MEEPTYVLLSELVSISAIVDDPVFTDVSQDGENYITYRVIRFTHEISHHVENWTHLANVALEYETGFGVAFLRVKNRVIEESRMKPTPPEVN